jgi:hypothetical protein
MRLSGGCRHALLGKWMTARHTDRSTCYLYMQWDLSRHAPSGSQE